MNTKGDSTLSSKMTLETFTKIELKICMLQNGILSE